MARMAGSLNRIRCIPILLLLLALAAAGGFARSPAVQATGPALREDGLFTLAITADMREFAGPGFYDTSQYFRGACEATAGLGEGDLMVIPGDLDPTTGVQWTITATLGSGYPWYPVVGNHELPGAGSEPYWGANMEWLRAYGYGPVNPGPTGCPSTTYSFDYQNTHLVMLNEYCDAAGDTVTDGNVPDHLYDWLVADLGNTQQEHILVFGHEPAYPWPDADNGRLRHLGDSLDQYPVERDRFWDLLRSRGAIYICGHTHNYSVVFVDGVWQVDAGHARGAGDPGAASTVVLLHLNAETVTYDTYRDFEAGGAYTLTHSGTLDKTVTGLVAANDSPTELGRPTMLSATIAAGTNVTYTWALGDGSVGAGRGQGGRSGTTITHTYLAPGFYTATVTASNSISSLSTTTVVQVEEAVAGLAAWNDGPTVLGIPTTLSATIAAGTNVTYTWALGDGSVGAGRGQGGRSGTAITHTYPLPGLYTATVTVSNSISSLSTTTVVQVEEAVAGLAAWNDSPTELGRPTTLSATIAAGTNVTYTWAFGHGSIGAVSSPLPPPPAPPRVGGSGEGGQGGRSGTAITHTYPLPGLYTAAVTAGNSVSLLTATTPVSIYCHQPAAAFAWMPLTPTSGLTVTFHSTATGTPPVNLAWSFGDGSQGSGPNPAHAYRAAGRYTVTMAVTNACGVAEAAHSLLVVSQPPPSSALDGPWNRDVLAATSGDGLTFGLPALLVERAGVPQMIRDSSGRLVAVFQWFPLDQRAAFDRVGVIFSTDEGATWTVPQAISVGGFPPDLARPYDPTVVQLANGDYRLYFTSNTAGPSAQQAIYSAISSDAVHYTFEAGARFAPANGTVDCSVIYFNGLWHLFSHTREAMTGRGYHATSLDGLAFTQQADVNVGSGYQWIGNAIVVAGGLRYYGAARDGIWSAISTDGATWALEGIRLRNVGDASAVVLPDGHILLLAVGPMRQDAVPPPFTVSAFEAGSPLPTPAAFGGHEVWPLSGTRGRCTGTETEPQRARSAQRLSWFSTRRASFHTSFLGALGALGGKKLSESSQGQVFREGERTRQWLVERADAPRLFTGMTDRALALDASDRPHVAYGGDRLYYAYDDGATWHTEVVDPAPQVGEHAALALDASDRPHIAYYDKQNGDLKYAFHDGTAWHVETVDTPGTVGRYTSIALDAAGRPRIAYYDAGNADLRYASYDGAAWITTTVDSAGWVGYYTSLALDDQDQPHISYLGGGNLRYARFDGTAWLTETVDGAGDVAWPTSLALDNAGRPHIAYFRDNDLHYARYNGASWQLQTVDPFYDAGYDVSLALDAQDRPHISYYDYVMADLKYAYYNGSTWIFGPVSDPGAVGWFTSLALDTAGRPHIAYYDLGSNVLKVASYDGTAWQLQQVDRAGDVGYDGALALDASNHPHISYYDFLDGDLEYIDSDGSRWITTTVDSPGKTGRSTSLALDAAAYPHIAYYAETDSALRYARFDGTAWLTETVDGVGDVGWAASLALDASNRPHIAYYDAVNADLRYASYDGAAWITTTVDRAGDLGWSTSLVLDGADHPHIAYSDATNGDLRYAAYDGSEWVTTTVDSAGFAGYFAALALDAAGRPHIAYYDAGNDDLKYASYDGTTWQIEVVDAAGDVGEHASLVLNAAGRPHIAYYDHTNAHLKYACHDGTGWQIETVDASPGVGLMAALALGAAGRPHIAYADATNGDLKYATIQPCTPVARASIAGPTDLRAGETGLYTATYTPLTATLPVTLTWADGTIGPTAAYSWTDPGRHTITVTVRNECSLVTATLAITVCQPVQGAAVAGPAALVVGETGLYTATFLPITATLPLTWTWSNGDTGPTATYSWTLPGSHALTVTIANACSAVSASLAVEVCQPVLGVEVAGPPVLPVGTAGHYTATFLPLTATLPVTLAWDNGALGATAAYSWSLPGAYTITVTAANRCGWATNQQAVQVEAVQYGIYLPLVWR